MLDRLVVGSIGLGCPIDRLDFVMTDRLHRLYDRGNRPHGDTTIANAVLAARAVNTVHHAPSAVHVLAYEAVDFAAETAAMAIGPFAGTT